MHASTKEQEIENVNYQVQMHIKAPLSIQRPNHQIFP
jgi:hypothetical protein